MTDAPEALKTLTGDAVTNSPEGFNLEDWLVGGTDHRAKKSVTIWRDASLAERIEKLEGKISLAAKQESDDASMDSLGDSTLTTLEREKADLLARLEGAKAEVTVYGLIDQENADAVEAAGKGASVLDVTYEILARAGRLNGQELTAEQWAKLHETIGSQFTLITRAYREVLETPVDARFRR